MTVPDTMRAVVARRGAELGDLDVIEVPVARSPAPGEVRVRVAAAGVNPVDVKSRQGRGAASFLSPDPARDPFPWIPGWDVAGVVADVGRGVARFAPGDRVFGTVGFPRAAGGYAEYVTAPVAHLARTPDVLDDTHAAALPMAALTAWQGLVDAGGLVAGQTVVVTAAAGGVGHLAVQIARDRGAHVVAIGSAGNLAFLRELGADEVVDRGTDGWAAGLPPADLVLDMFGGDGFPDLAAAVRSGGRIVTVSSVALDGVPDGVSARMVVVASDGHELAQIAEAVARRTVVPVLAGVLPLERAGEAHERLETGRTRGKLVLAVGPTTTPTTKEHR